MQEEPTLSALMESRERMYAFLSRLFLKEADAQLIESIRSMPTPPETGNADVDEGYRLILKSVNEGGDVEQELAVDYAHVFIGSGTDGHAAAYPYESVYTSEKRLLMQRAYHEVIEEYRQAGYKKGSRREPDDHIGIELEFMELLCARAKGASGDDDGRAGVSIRRQATFLGNHLTNWVPAFSSEMISFARTDFYRGLALLTRGFIASDRELLATLVEV